MRLIRTLVGSAVLLGMAIGMSVLPGQSAPPVPAPPGQAEGTVPAYHKQRPTGLLPTTLSPTLFNDPVIKNAYAAAARIKKTLYQLPCYCHCDRSAGHGSLLDCYVSQHASGCDICMKEVFFASEKLRKGTTVAQIREAIIKGEWEQQDLTRYRQYPPAR